MKRVLPKYAVPPNTFGKKEYLTELKNWGIQQTDRRKRIAILGAGMAGLVSGWLLKNAGHDVTIFEASNVVGGRVKTLRERFTSGMYAEAGAMRVPKTHVITNWLIKEVFHLSTFEFPNTSPHAYIYINNERHTFAQYQRQRHTFGFDLSPREQNKFAGEIFEQCIVSYVRSTQEWEDFEIHDLDDDSSEQKRARLRRLMEDVDTYSLREFLKRKAKIDGHLLSRGCVDMITALLTYEMHLSSSMAAILGDYHELNSGVKLRQIKGGMDLLPKAFVEPRTESRKIHGARILRPDLAGEVRYNARVTEMIYHGGMIELQFENPITRRQDKEDYHLVVISVPFSALRHIRMRHLTGAEKRRALRQLHYDNSCKILLEFENCFWLDQLPERKPIEGGQSLTDLPVRQIYYASPKQNRNNMGRGLLLASYTWGDDSLRWTSLKPDDRIRFALRDLERVHGMKDTTLEKLCVGGMSHSWAENEFTSGAFAMFEPYQLTELFADIWVPEGRLHYCGEHTSTKHGWIEGAVQSGIRVAKEICHRLADDPKLLK